MAKISIFIGIIILATALVFVALRLSQKQSQTPESLNSNQPENIQTSPESTQSSKSNRSLQTPKPVESLDITGCNPIPKQLKLKIGQDFQVKNNDKVAHTIIIDASHKFVIPAESTTTLSSTFGASGIIGTIGYRCDNASSEAFVGTFHISE